MQLLAGLARERERERDQSTIDTTVEFVCGLLPRTSSDAFICILVCIHGSELQLSPLRPTRMLRAS
jgi:hypothetical protein